MQQIQRRPLTEVLGERGQHPAGMAVVRVVEVGEIRDVGGMADMLALAILQEARQQFDRQGMIAERFARRFQFGIATAYAFDTKQRASGFGRQALQILLQRGLGKVRKLLDRLARGDHAKPGISHRQTLDQPG